MAKNCPHCKLVNPSEAQRCDCGYDFQSQQMKPSYLESKQIRKAATAGVGGLTVMLVFWLMYRGVRLLVWMFSN